MSHWKEFGDKVFWKYLGEKVEAMDYPPKRLHFTYVYLESAMEALDEEDVNEDDQYDVCMGFLWFVMFVTAIVIMYSHGRTPVQQVFEYITRSY